jgi:hypothetical protein
MLADRAFAAISFLCLLSSCRAPDSAPPPAEKSQFTIQPDGVTPQLQRLTGKPLYNLEMIGNVIDPFPKQPVVVSASEVLSVVGWAVDGASKNAAAGVEVVVDGRPYRAEAKLDRPDVAAFYKAPEYRRAGFRFSAPASAFGAGKHVLSIRTIANDGKAYFEGLDLTLEIR